LILPFHWLCPRSKSEPAIDANSERTLRVDVAQHIMKHNSLHENENVRNPALWAEATSGEFYFEASYPSNVAYPDVDGSIRASDSILLMGFPADPFNDKKNDSPRMNSLQSWFERLRSTKFYDITKPETVGHETGAIPIKYNDGRDVPLTLAIQARISKIGSGGTLGRSVTLEEVLTLIREAGDPLRTAATPSE
jgi:hypothetical protein